jgi:allophanate hydrolase
LDCVSVFARDVPLAARAAAIAGAASDDDDPWSRNGTLIHPPDRPLRVALARTDGLTFDGDESTASRHALATAAVAAELATVARVVDLPGADLELLVTTGRLLYEGAFVAERYSSVGEFVDAHPDEVDPVVGSIISAAGRLPAWRLAADLSTLAGARRRAALVFEHFDAIVLPTVPRLPTVDQVQRDPIAVNSMLGTYTNFVNLLDLCAVTVPVPIGDDDLRVPPPSVSVIGPAWSDDLVVSLAERIAGGPATLPTR